MKELTNIQGQQFYHASVSDFLKFCSENNCALIIDEDNAKVLLQEGIDNLKNTVSQIIYISENVGTLLKSFIGVNVFIMSASSVEQAVKFAVHSNALNNNVVCVVNDQVQIKNAISNIKS